MFIFFFFFNDTATTEIYTLSLHDALPIYGNGSPAGARRPQPSHTTNVAGPVIPRPFRPPGSRRGSPRPTRGRVQDRKSTRLNSSHANISYAVFCLKKKKKYKKKQTINL